MTTTRMMQKHTISWYDKIGPIVFHYCLYSIKMMFFFVIFSLWNFISADEYSGVILKNSLVLFIIRMNNEEDA